MMQIIGHFAELFAEMEEKVSNINSAVAALKSLIGDLEEEA